MHTPFTGSVCLFGAALDLAAADSRLVCDNSSDATPIEPPHTKGVKAEPLVSLPHSEPAVDCAVHRAFGGNFETRGEPRIHRHRFHPHTHHNLSRGVAWRKSCAEKPQLLPARPGRLAYTRYIRRWASNQTALQSQTFCGHDNPPNSQSPASVRNTACALSPFFCPCSTYPPVPFFFRRVERSRIPHVASPFEPLPRSVATQAPTHDDESTRDQPLNLTKPRIIRVLGHALLSPAAWQWDRPFLGGCWQPSSAFLCAPAVPLAARRTTSATLTSTATAPLIATSAPDAPRECRGNSPPSRVASDTVDSTSTGPRCLAMTAVARGERALTRRHARPPHVGTTTQSTEPAPASAKGAPRGSRSKSRPRETKSTPRLAPCPSSGRSTTMAGASRRR